jgi:hypothetical protein
VGSLVSKPSRSSVTPGFCASSNLASGKSKRAGMENNAHHTPEPPTRNRGASVDPCALHMEHSDSGSKISAMYPTAMSSEEMQMRGEASLYRHGP